MALSIVDGPTIKINESLSDGVDCSAGNIVRITVPQEFTPSNLTFQVSSDGNFYNDLFSSKRRRDHRGRQAEHRHRHSRRVVEVDQLHQVQIGLARSSGKAEGRLQVRHRGRDRRRCAVGIRIQAARHREMSGCQFCDGAARMVKHQLSRWRALASPRSRRSTTASTATSSVIEGGGTIEWFGEAPPIIKRVLFQAGITLKHNPPRLSLLCCRDRYITTPAIGLYATSGDGCWSEVHFTETGVRELSRRIDSILERLEEIERRLEP